MQTIIETITPAKAEEYLATSKGNRPLNKSAVRSYADSMLKGKWLLNGVPIIFDNKGCLIDGHHRLNAIIQSGIPVQTAVCRGVQSEVFTTIDQGRTKSLGQLLAVQKTENYNIVASIVGGNDTLVKVGKLWGDNGARLKHVSNMDFYDEYQRHAEDYQEAARIAGELWRLSRLIKTAWLGSLYYYLVHTGCYRGYFVYGFLRAVCCLDTSGINQADELRKFIIRNDRKDRKLSNELLFAIICKAWNAYVSNKTVKCYKFNPEKEPYPKLKLNFENKRDFEGHPSYFGNRLQ